MELLKNLFEGYPNLWGGGVAHSVLILSLVIAFGIMLGKIKISGISLGVTWILFVGIVFGHFNLNLDEHLLHFLKEFGLIYNPQIQISAESETKRSIFRKRDKTKRSKKESAQHSKSRNKSFVMTSVSAL